MLWSLLLLDNFIGMDSQLQALLSEHAAFFTTLDNGKIQCTLNGHSFPAKYEALASFVSGSKYLKLRKKATVVDALSQYEPFIVVSKNFPNMLYCALTGQLMDASVEAIKRHMQGKKFKRASHRFHQDQQELKPEPDIDELLGNKPSSTASMDLSDEDVEQLEEEDEDHLDTSDVHDMDEDVQPEDSVPHGDVTQQAANNHALQPDRTLARSSSNGLGTSDVQPIINGNPKPRKQNVNRPSKSKRFRM